MVMFQNYDFEAGLPIESPSSFARGLSEGFDCFYKISYSPKLVIMLSVVLRASLKSLSYFLTRNPEISRIVMDVSFQGKGLGLSKRNQISC